MPDKLRVLLADDHRSYVEGLTALFQNDDRILFCGHVHSPEQVAPAVEAHQPQVVLMDYSFGDGQQDGIETADQLLQHYPLLKIILLTSYDDAPIVQAAFTKGLHGFLLKTHSRSEIKTAIEAAAAGFEVATAGMLRKVIKPPKLLPPGNPDQDKAAPLTPRELEIALLMAAGLSTKAIAENLFLSVNTIDTHRKNIFSKLDVHNVAELIHWLRNRGLI